MRFRRRVPALIDYRSVARRKVAEILDTGFPWRPVSGPSELIERSKLGLCEVSGAAPAGTAAAAGRAPRLMPPTVKRGEHWSGESIPTQELVELVLADGKVKMVTKRTGINGDAAFIDWVNFTVHESTCGNLDDGMQIMDRDIINVLSIELLGIFGFGITRQCERGRNFYLRAYELGDGFGFVCHGGQRNTVLVMLSGEGCGAAKPGWQQRLYDFLSSKAIQPRLTRVDCAHDCFAGEYTVDQGLADWDAGMYRLSRSPRDPEVECRGNWRRPSGKGRTLCIGLRTSGKYLRIYEKGMQLGDPNSRWVRVEVELKSVDRVLPFDILINPGMYLSGSYPALAWVHESQERIRTTRETKVIDKSAKEDWIYRVAGPDLYVLTQLEQGETFEAQAANLIRRLSDESRMPKWANLPTWDVPRRYVHEDFHAPAEAPGDMSWCVRQFDSEMTNAIPD